MNSSPLKWHKVLELPGLDDGRVTTVTIGKKSIALTKHQDKYGALDNACPHQGGPLGEGSIEHGAEDKCWLRCPWHGWDFDPLTGQSPGGHGDGLETFAVEERSDGIYIGLEPQNAEPVTSISDILAQSMVNWGIKQVFGMVGHSNLGMADALRRQEEQGKLNFYGIRHEGAAAFASSAYAKLTGKPAACFAIAGPGATNLLTGLYDAKMDRSPVLALAGQVDSQVLGPGNFQEVNLQGAFTDVSAFNHTVFADSKHGELVALAIKKALLTSNPVNLILPNKVQETAAPSNAAPSSPEGRLANLAIAPPQEEFEKAVSQIKEAKRPLIIVGYGARFHRDKIIAFAERLQIPVATTFKAKGIISDTHPLGCGVLGRSGTPVASWFMNECDRIIAVGTSFSNHTGIASYIPTIQIDFDPLHLAKIHAVDTLLYGEIGRTFELLLEAFPINQDNKIPQEVAQRWAIWRTEKTNRLKDNSGNGINSSSVFDAMNRIVQKNSILAVDVGNNTYSFGRYFESSGNQAVLMSGYLGSIGFGYPAAIGAWAATTEQNTIWHNRAVWCVTGDGGFGQYMMEVLTAVKYKMNITHVLLNNKELGKISKEQRVGEFKVWKTGLHNPNFAEYANICGAKGIQVEKAEDIEKALIEARDYDGPATVEIIADVNLI